MVPLLVEIVAKIPLIIAGFLGVVLAGVVGFFVGANSFLAVSH
jgi:hypothetical protein